MLALRVRSALKAYDNFVIKSPLIGTAITSGVGMAAGNLICQSIMYFKQDKALNMHSFLQYAAFGLIISGPTLRYWWYALDLKVFENPNSFLRPVKMMVVDQLTTPYVLNAAFLYFISITDGKSNQESIKDVEKNLLRIVFESYKVWPLATLINFYLIPLHNRVLFSNIMGVLWSTYLTFLIHHS